MGVRVHLGRLDAFGKAGYGLLVKTGLIGAGTNTQIDDGGLVVTKDGIERVRVGDISGGAGTDYGLKVVNAGTAVIIDGSSNMFKIVASGSLAVTIPAWAGAGNPLAIAQTDLTLTGLGAQSTIPAHLSFVGPTTNPTDERKIGITFRRRNNGNFVAGASGGAATSEMLALTSFTQMRTFLDGSNMAHVNMVGESAESTGAITQNGRFHVLQEAAL